MARSPIYGSVVRALRLASYAERTGLDVAEVVARAEAVRHARALARAGGEAEASGANARAPGWTRRSFLKTAAAGSAGVVLTACGGARATPVSGPRDAVVIVGAGLAGLVAAKELRAAGVPVRLFEAQNRVGGRVWSIRDYFADGQVAELGGELIDTGHGTMHALARELAIELDDLTETSPSIAANVWHFDGARRTESEVVAAFVPLARQVAAAVANLRSDLTYRDAAGAESLDRLSIAEWLDRAGASGWARELIEVAYTTEYGREVDEQSALNLVFVLDPGGDPDRIFGESDERFHVRGGNDLIVSRLAEPLADAIELTTMLEAVRRRSDGWYTCTFRRGSGSFDVDAPDVILTIPFTLLREVRLDVELPPVKQRAIAELMYGTNAKLMVGFTERVWRTRHASSGSVLTDLPFQQVWETSRGQPGTSGILTNFTGGRHGLELAGGSAAWQAAMLITYLVRVFPGVASARGNAREVRLHWPTHPWVRGSYACYGPGQWTSLRGAEGEPVERLFFAGEHCSLDAQGFMEGAAETGQAAARAVLAVRGAAAGSPGLGARYRPARTRAELLRPVLAR